MGGGRHKAFHAGTREGKHEKTTQSFTDKIRETSKGKALRDRGKRGRLFDASFKKTRGETCQLGLGKEKGHERSWKKGRDVGQGRKVEEDWLGSGSKTIGKGETDTW